MIIIYNFLIKIYKSKMDYVIDIVLQNLKHKIVELKKNNSDVNIKKHIVENIYNNLIYSLDDNITKEYIYNRLLKIEDYQKQLEKVKKISVIVQRTDEWFNTRKNLITASDMAQALNMGKFGSQKKFIMKKVDSLLSSENTYIQSDNPALVWGTKYEEVANKIYMKRNKIIVFEFGLIKHNILLCFGASPDGISELGIMLEIKCPYVRKINGSIPKQYWIQIQGQLEVCDLEECDYLECSLKEYNSEKEFIEDSHNNNILTEGLKEKGIMIEYKDNNERKYLYSELNKTNEEMIQWKRDVICKFNVTTKYEIYYWRLNEYFCKRVYRDRDFFNNNIKNLKFLWNKIEYYKDNQLKYISDIKNNKKAKIYDFDKKTVNSILNGFAFKETNED
jgi:putative phage-type endonuclease